MKNLIAKKLKITVMNLSFHHGDFFELAITLLFKTSEFLNFAQTNRRRGFRQ
jgi:hypothetical protein